MENRYKIHSITGIITAVLVGILGISLAAVCIVIYFNGTNTPFSREIVSAHVKYVIIQTILTVAAVISGAAIKIFMPLPKSGLSGVRDASLTHSALEKKLKSKDSRLLYADTVVIAEKKYRSRLNLIKICVVITSFAVALVLTVLNEYTIENINGSVVRATIGVLSATLVAGAAVFVISNLNESSLRREIEQLKKLIVIASDPEGDGKTSIEAAVRLAITFTVIGIFNGGASDVLGKAVRICTECIGLG